MIRDRLSGWPLGLGGAFIIAADAATPAPSSERGEDPRDGEQRGATTPPRRQRRNRSPSSSSPPTATAPEALTSADPFDAVLLQSPPPSDDASGAAIVRTVVEIVPYPVDDREISGETTSAGGRRDETAVPPLLLLHPYLIECLRAVLRFSPSSPAEMEEGVGGARHNDNEGGAAFATSARNSGDFDGDGDATGTSHAMASKASRCEGHRRKIGDGGGMSVLVRSGAMEESGEEESTMLPFVARRIDVIDADTERRRRRRRRRQRRGGGDDGSCRGGGGDGIVEEAAVDVLVRCCHPHATAASSSFRERLEEGLEGRLVVPSGGLIVVALPPPHLVVSEEARIDDVCGEDDGGGVAHVLVEEVRVRTNGGMNVDENDAGFGRDEGGASPPRPDKSPSRGIVEDDADVAYRLGRVGTFSVTLLPWDDDGDSNDNNSDLDDVEGTENDQQQHPPAVHRPLAATTQTLCPGYEDLLGRLMELVNLQESSPSPLLLTGCAGVGKTRLASSLLDSLLLPPPAGASPGCRSPSSSAVGRPSTHIVSAKDLLLLAASSLSHDDDRHSWPSSPLDRHVLPPRLMQQRRRGRKVILVIDEIDALLDGGDDDGSSVGDHRDHERAACLRAISGMLDVLVGDGGEGGGGGGGGGEWDIGNVHNCHDRDDDNPTPFILGISRVPLSRLPPLLARVGRFEREVVVPPPTESQRERVLSHWLRRLPIVSGSISSSATINTDGRPTTRGGGPSVTGAIGTEDAMATATAAAVLAERWAAALAPQTAGCVAADLRRVCADALVAAHAATAASSPRVRRDARGGTGGDRDGSARTAMPPGGDDEGGGVPPVVGVTWDHVREAARACVPSQLAMLDVRRASTFDDYDDALGNEVGPEFDDGGRRIDATVAAVRRRRRRRHDLSWKSFGGYGETKTRLYRAVVGPWASHISSWGSASSSSRSLSSHAKMGVSPPSGVLFHGPSGCGKTFAAECLASSLGLNVVKVRASNVLDQWLGGSEATIRSLFARARAAAPCVLFFDEIDALASNREDEDGAGEVHSRVLSTLLNEMDGISSDSNKQGVLVVAATNRLDAIDAALLRPGRLDQHVLLSYPTVNDCIDILQVHSRKLPLSNDVGIEDLAELLHELGASGADIEGVCRQTCLIALWRTRNIEDIGEISVTLADFDASIEQWKR